jgi:hypothetical protein
MILQVPTAGHIHYHLSKMPEMTDVPEEPAPLSSTLKKSTIFTFPSR